MSENRKTKRRGKAGRILGRWIKRLVLLAVVVAAGRFGLKAYIRNQAGNADDEQGYTQAQVRRGAI